MLGVMELVAIFFVFGCPTWLLSKLIDRAFGGKQKRAPIGDKEAQDRARMLESQLLDARLQNDQLQKQLEWHTKMLATQDRLMQRSGDTIAEPAEVRA
jgi:hypothetical protein